MRPESSIGSCLIRGFAIWILLAAVETAHGTLRAIYLAPRVGDLASRRIGVATGSLLILIVAFLAIDWIGARSRASLAAVGIMWLVLMLAFEIGVGRAFGLSWTRIASEYVPWQGGYMLLGMTFLAMSPSIALRLRSGHR